MRQKVRRGDEADIVAPRFLQGKHLLRKRFNGELFTETFLADLIILTEAALEMAVAEKNGARAPGTRQNRLFTKMSKCFSDLQFTGCLTLSELTAGAVSAALPGAEPA